MKIQILGDRVGGSNSGSTYRIHIVYTFLEWGGYYHSKNVKPLRFRHVELVSTPDPILKDKKMKSLEPGWGSYSGSTNMIHTVYTFLVCGSYYLSKNVLLVRLRLIEPAFDPR